jgi:multidrug resistance efflux pump
MTTDRVFDSCTIRVRQPFGSSVAGLDIPHYGVIVLFSIFFTVLMLAIAGATTYSRTVIASGLTTFSSGAAQVASPQLALISTVHVHQGDFVKKGAALITLDLHKYPIVGQAVDEHLFYSCKSNMTC